MSTEMVAWTLTSQYCMDREVISVKFGICIWIIKSYWLRKQITFSVKALTMIIVVDVSLQKFSELRKVFVKTLNLKSVEKGQ